MVKKISFCLIVGLLILTAAQTIVSAEEEKKDNDFRLYWKEGIRMDSSDKKFKIKFGGRLMTDVTFGSGGNALEEEVGDIENSVEVRRARLYSSGTIYDNVEYKLQFDFAGGDADLKDGYVGIKKMFGNTGVRIGHFNEPFCLDELTSSKYISFIERSTSTAFAPGRNMGAMLHGHNNKKSATWALGYFRNTDDYGEDSNKASHFTGRATFTPMYEDKGKRALHLGIAASHRDYVSTARFRARPEVHDTHRFVDTGSFDADSALALGLEAALVEGPFSLQGEYMRTSVSVPTDDSPTFSSYYLQATCFLTGEHRKYKPKSGGFSRTKPHSDFLTMTEDEKPHSGAWELTARYSALDLDDAAINGGQLKDITLGLNWYLNPNTRMMVNYVKPTVSGVGNASFYTMRFQFDF